MAIWLNMDKNEKVELLLIGGCMLNKRRYMSEVAVTAGGMVQKGALFLLKLTI